MPVPFAIYCNDCDKELFVHGRRLDADGDLRCAVEPCETCLDDAHQEGRDAAKAEGSA